MQDLSENEDNLFYLKTECRSMDFYVKFNFLPNNSLWGRHRQVDLEFTDPDSVPGYPGYPGVASTST